MIWFVSLFIINIILDSILLFVLNYYLLEGFERLPNETYINKMEDLDTKFLTSLFFMVLILIVSMLDFFFGFNHTSIICFCAILPILCLSFANCVENIIKHSYLFYGESMIENFSKEKKYYNKIINRKYAKFINFASRKIFYFFYKKIENQKLLREIIL